jgi:hypothetical protein
MLNIDKVSKYFENKQKQLNFQLKSVLHAKIAAKAKNK